MCCVYGVRLAWVTRTQALRPGLNCAAPTALKPKQETIARCARLKLEAQAELHDARGVRLVEDEEAATIAAAVYAGVAEGVGAGW